MMPAPVPASPLGARPPAWDPCGYWLVTATGEGYQPVTGGEGGRIARNRTREERARPTVGLERSQG